MGELNTDAGSVPVIMVSGYLCSVSFLTIMTPSFWPASRCEFYTDMLLGFMHMQMQKRFPPVDFFVGAWESMMRHLCEYARDGKSFCQAFEHESSWRHYWTSWVPPVPQTLEKQPRGRNTGQETTEASEKELKRLREENKSLQSQKDRLANLSRTRSLDLCPQKKGRNDDDSYDNRRDYGGSKWSYDRSRDRRH